MKHSKTNIKTGYFQRLKERSLILSCLGSLSDKIIYFFKLCILSVVFSGGDRSDALIEKSAINQGIKQVDVKRRFITKAKAICARAIESSPVTKSYKRLIENAVYTPTSTFGAFFVTFGIYVGLVYCVKYFAFEYEDVNIYSLITSCIIILSAFPLLFSRKPLIKYLESSAFVRSALNGCIPFGIYENKKGASAFGTAIIFGSVFGVLTFFFNELRVLLFIFAMIMALVVLYAPEIGLFAVAVALPFLDRKIAVVLICYTFGCYLTKVLRGKRNLHLDAGNIFALFLLACFGFTALRGGGVNAMFAFSATAIYIMAANMLVTKTLLQKCVRALCLGLSGVIVVFLFQLFTAAYNKQPIGDAVLGSFSVFENSGMLIKYCLVLLPFRFCKSLGAAPFSKATCYLLAAGVACYSIYTGHVFLAVATSVTVALYLTVNGRQIIAPLFLCVGVPLLALYFSGISIDLTNLGAYNTIAGWVDALKTGTSYPFLGCGMSTESLTKAGLGDSRSMYLQTLAECGLCGFILLVMAVVFATQRLYTALPKVGTDDRRIAAAAGASAIIGLILGAGSNLWQDSGLCLVLWLSLGIASAACHTRMAEKKEMDNEFYG